MPFNSVQNQIKTSKEDILTELHRSAETATVMGLFLKDPHDLITTAVKNLNQDSSGEWIINLMDQDLHGYPIDNPTVLLSNIERVIPFNIAFDDPLYLRERRKEKFKV